MQPPTIYKPGKLGYLWNYLGSSLKSFAAALSPYMGGDAGVKKYFAIVRQSGIGDPEALVISNTIGDIVWTRLTAGLYELTCPNAFPEHKVMIQIQLGYGQSAYFSYAQWRNISTLWVSTWDVGNQIDFDSGSQYEMFITIEVYP